MLQTIGPERTRAFVEQALAIEASGGVLLTDGSRKRTLGGVFFRLVRDQVSEAERRAIWPYQPRKGHQPRAKAHAAPTPALLPPFQWETADEVITPISKNQGAQTIAKVNL